MGQKITPNLWFDTEAEEAAAFYVSVFENSRVLEVARYTEAGPRPAGTVMTVAFELDGQRFVGINGGPQFTFDEAVSFEVECETQEEVDYFWEKLSEGGEEGPAAGSRTASASPGRSSRAGWMSCSATPTRSGPSGR